MHRLDHFNLLADYNRWMNAKLYASAARLSPEALSADRGAFFHSLLGTLNHIVVGDTVWLKRFATLPACTKALQPVVELPQPTSLDQVQFTDLEALSAHRQWLDARIVEWVGVLSEADLDLMLEYRNTKGVASRRSFSALMVHFFNHQTHHRGQATTLLSQAGEDVGVTDLLMLIPDQLG